MYTDVTGWITRLGVQGYMAIEGCKYIIHSDRIMNDSYALHYERTGWGFVALNIVDEIILILRRHRGWDSHAHHILCGSIAGLNLIVSRLTTNDILRREILSSIMTLLANECVTPSFNIYTILARIGRGNSLGAWFAVASSIPMLQFRMINSLKVLWRAHTTRQLKKDAEAACYRVTTTLLCAILISLDIVWLQWAIRKIIIITRTLYMVM